MKSRFVDLDSCHLHYYEYEHRSPKRTIVLLHGLGTSSSTWLNIFPYLLSNYRVIAVDLPGFGFSTIQNGKEFFTLRDHDEAIRSFVKQVPLPAFVLIGHSFGGWLAARFAAANSECVEQLVLINNAGIYYRGVEEIPKLFAVTSTAECRKLLERMWYHYPWYFKPFTPAILRDLSSRKVNALVSSIEAGDFLVEELSQLTMPVDVIWGKEDRLLSAESLATMRRLVPRFATHAIYLCGHVPQLERPRDLIGVLDRVLGKEADDSDGRD